MHLLKKRLENRLLHSLSRLPSVDKDFTEGKRPRPPQKSTDGADDTDKGEDAYNFNPLYPRPLGEHRK